ncbi:hypothetical protein PHLGIDRAFT_35490 [Phlebiopsis gigantea 11061_1 CR5-6]|uniref:Glycosyltransferase family 25 protein n=1 Tax=Phlebiopsis gigantea (strain 11061_1 CR5-6) TaxID=745531 RepID=A0A0C3NQB9_PHLG1|nr:hypothetical protein PHLGIDRAFT_35490 [Phlebiopsis gigantea 11061_1 CR5-6]
MNSHRRTALLALGILSGFWSLWIYFDAGPLAVSEATLDLLGDIFSLVQTYPPHSQDEPPESARYSLMPMPAVQEFAQAPAADNASTEIASQATWPGFAETYVVSLPGRTDRRIGMERIRQVLPWLNWAYVPATPADDPRIGRIYDRVREQRRALARENVTAFAWPADLDTPAHPPHASPRPLGHGGADLWEAALSSPAGADAAYARDGEPRPELEPLACASRDAVDGPPYAPALPPYMILSRAKMACWHSHAQVLRAIAGRYADDNATAAGDDESGRARDREVALILEDDVDVEQDLYERMEDVWLALPDEWDMLFLGHCWSDEAHHTALPSPGGAAAPGRTRVHPSRAPKCTHAYAVTRAGARRLVAHLRVAPFAYGRALDQAYAWLVLAGRVQSYSVVPSVVVQRKVGASDIDGGHAGVGVGVYGVQGSVRGRVNTLPQLGEWT